MMLRWLLGLLALAFVVPAAAQDAEATRSVIEAAMADSAAGWNSGSLDRFLAIYSDDPATSFAGSKGLARGKAGIRDQYLASYPALFGPTAGGTPPRLSFAYEDFRTLGADHALVIAQWKLTTPEAKEQAGMTTLVFRKEAGGWKIIADHSS